MSMKNRFRPTLEGYEDRVLMAAHALASLATLAPPTPADTGRLTHNPIVNVDHAVSLAQGHSHPVFADGFDETYPDSIISIENDSNYTVYYYFRWDDTSWQYGTLAPGQGYYYWDTGAGHNGYIDFEKDVGNGWQQQVYLLASNTAAEGGFADLTPQFSDGHLYSFQTTSYAPLDLYDMGN